MGCVQPMAWDYDLIESRLHLLIYITAYSKKPQHFNHRSKLMEPQCIIELLSVEEHKYDSNQNDWDFAALQATWFSEEQERN